MSGGEVHCQKRHGGLWRDMTLNPAFAIDRPWVDSGPCPSIGVWITGLSGSAIYGASQPSTCPRAHGANAFGTNLLKGKAFVAASASTRRLRCGSMAMAPWAARWRRQITLVPSTSAKH